MCLSEMGDTGGFFSLKAQLNSQGHYFRSRRKRVEQFRFHSSPKR